MALTTSQRAKQLMQLNPGMTRSEAMKQAYREIVTKKAEEDEANAKEDIDQWIDDIYNAIPGMGVGKGGLNFDALNALVSDMLYKAVKVRRDKGIKYPYTSLRNAIKDKLSGSSEVNNLVFASNDERFIAFEIYRGMSGKILSDWINDFDRITRVFGVDPTSVPHYGEIRKEFI